MTLIWAEGDPVTLDLESGDTTLLDGWPSLRCSTSHEYLWSNGFTTDLDEWFGANVVELCDVEGEPSGDAATDEVAAGLVRVAGMDAGDGFWLLTTDTGLHLYDLN